jgi:hypothetical protein
MTNDPYSGASELQRLLALKRHERPPPGYFDAFPGKVLARIEAAERARHASWWQRLWTQFDAKPLVACAYGVALGSVLVLGFSFITLSEDSATGPLATSLALEPTLLSRPDSPRLSAAMGIEPTLESSMNPVTLGPPAFLFQGSGVTPTLVSWPVTGQ